MNADRSCPTIVRDIYVFGHLRGVVGSAEQFARYVHDLVEDGEWSVVGVGDLQG